MSELTEFEKEVYEFVKVKGELQIADIPKMMWGAIPKLKQVGLIETCKKKTTPWASKKHTFVQAIEQK